MLVFAPYDSRNKHISFTRLDLHAEGHCVLCKSQANLLQKMQILFNYQRFNGSCSRVAVMAFAQLPCWRCWIQANKTSWWNIVTTFNKLHRISFNKSFACGFGLGTSVMEIISTFAVKVKDYPVLFYSSTFTNNIYNKKWQKTAKSREVHRQVILIRF